MPSPMSMFGPPIRVNVPGAFADERTLLAFLGLSEVELKKIWWFRGQMYSQFDIAKPGGKKRLISAPDRRLKMLQRKIATLLGEIYRPRHPVHGFVNGRSVKTNASAHLRSKFVVNLDVDGFFPSISERRVSGLFSALGIDGRVAEIVARICCNEGALPQGAPSSPVISNMICFRLDRQLQAIAKGTRCIYTRYADDITFSSYQPLSGLFEGSLPPPGPFSPDLLRAELLAVFLHNGFSINAKKAHYADKHSRRSVTGLKINELVNVDRRVVRNLRAALFSVEKHGLSASQKTLEDKYLREVDIAHHLRGRISWVGHIKGASDPVFRGLASRFNALFPSQKMGFLPTSDEIRDRSVWVIENWDTPTGGEQGTGFFLKGIGLITACHVVEGAAELEVYHPSKPANKFKATIERIDKQRDLAILRHEIPSTEYFDLELTRRELLVGEQLTAVGYPGFGPGDKINVRPGTISSLPTKGGVPMIEVTQKLSQGMSGGPLVDQERGVAGVIHKGGPAEGRDFAIHMKAIVAWLNE